MKYVVILGPLLAIALLFFVVFETKPKENPANEISRDEGKTHTNASPKIVFSRKKDSDRGWSIYMMDSDGSNEKILIPYRSGMGEYNPDISPDGKTVLFNTYRYGGWKLATYDIESKTTTRITFASNYFTNGVFSPDGRKIAYEKNVQRSTHIFIADRNGQNEKTLTAKMGNENRIPGWSPDGKSIVFYSDKDGKNDIYKVAIDGGEITNLTKNKSGNDFAPSVSPDGKQIAFFSDRNGYLDLYIMNFNGTDQVNLTKALQTKNNTYNYYKDNNLFWIFKASWSPDGNSIVFSSVVNDNVDLFTIQKDGLNLKRLTVSPKSEFTPVWGKITQ